jgi:hypothetical protein
VPFAVDCLRIVSLGFAFYAYGMVTIQAFNGAGGTTIAVVLFRRGRWKTKRV